MKALISGAAGAIGMPVAKRILLGHGDEVIVLYNPSDYCGLTLNVDRLKRLGSTTLQCIS